MQQTVEMVQRTLHLVEKLEFGKLDDFCNGNCCMSLLPKLTVPYCGLLRLVIPLLLS